MRASRSVAKNTILLTFGLFTGRLLAVFLRKKMTPILGADGLGILFTALGLNQIMLTVARFGLGVLLTREISRFPNQTARLFWGTMRIRWVIAALSYGVMFAYVEMLGYTIDERTAVLLLGIGLFIESAGMACDSVLQAHEKVELQTAGQLASAAAYFGFGWWWLDAGYGLMGVIWANVVSQAVRLLVMAPLMFWKTGPWTFRRRPDEPPAPRTADLLRSAFPLFLSTTFGVIYTKIDTVMLKSMVSTASAGVYGLGHQGLDVMMMVPGLFGTAFFPAMARYGKQSPRDAARLGERALRFMMAGIVPLTLLLTFTAGPVIRWFDEKGEFLDSPAVMMIVIWGLPFQAAAVVLNRLIITADREKVFISIGFAAMLVNIVLNAVAIPRYSYYGASVATIISLAVSLAMHVGYLRGTEFLPRLRLALVGPVAATAAAWLLTVGLLAVARPDWGAAWNRMPLSGWTPFAVTTLAMTIIYPAVLFGMRVIRRDDLDLLKDVLRKG